MTELYQIADTYIWYVLCITSFVLWTGALAVLLRFLRDKRKTSPVVISILNLILISLVILVFVDCSKYPDGMRVFTSLQTMLFGLPYNVYLCIELLSCIILLSLSLNSSKYRSRNITSDAVQQAIDVLPEGIAICSQDGTVRLSNLKMNTLSQIMTDRLLTDGKSFWSAVKDSGKKQNGRYLVRLPDNEIWLFGKENMEVQGKDYEQITASNITERYRIIEELEAKHEHLQDIRDRMKAVSELSGDMFIAQEEADARAALHNQLGQVLLMGRHYINHKDTTDPKVVYAATMQMNQFLLGEAKEPYEGEEDTLAHAVSMANSIGVRVDIHGDEPSDGAVLKILAKTITECAANTVKHAEGDTVTVDIDPSEDHITVTITNNGKPPKNAITESGGLLSLRRDVEAMGGKMKMNTDPRFELILIFTKNGTNG